MEKIQFFDCEATFGMPGFKRENAPITKEAMLSRFERYGIDKAVIRFEYSMSGIAKTGNAEIIEEIKDDDNLFPMWAAIPHHTGEFPSPEELVALMKGNDVRLITLPEGDWMVGEWTCGELFSTLEKYKIPLFIPISRFVNTYNGLYETLKAHKNLRIILTGIGYNALRNLYPLMKQFENLYLCTSTLKTQLGIEDICKNFGAERLVFGSGMPVLSGAASVALITYAQISDVEKQKIASGNLERLMSEVAF